MMYGDIIRYIVVNFHPNNEMLKSDVTKRWEVINHLLISIQDVIALPYAINALSFDWMFYTK